MPDPQNQDVYPLGQGNGLLADALNFAMNNFYQYGNKAKDWNQRVGSTFDAIQQGKPTTELSPLISDITGYSPMTAGMIKPETWKAFQPEAKAAFNVFADRYPETFKGVLDAPFDLRALVTKDMPDQAAATYRRVTPEAGLIKLRPSYAPVPSTLGHEIQHSLNTERVANTNPLDALTIATLLRDYMPANNRGSLNTLLDQTVKYPGMMQKIMGHGDAPLQVLPNTNRHVARQAMDEAFAYLGQNAEQPRLTGNMDPMIQQLAARLGVKWR